MSRIEVSILINATSEQVWAVLADLGSPARYDPTIQSVKVIPTDAKGVGETREVELANGDKLRESITTFEPKAHLDFHAYAISMPIQGLDRSYTLETEAGRTRVTLLVEYEPKYGIFGRLLDSRFLRNRLTRMTQAGIYGLKLHVEGRRRNLTAHP